MKNKYQKPAVRVRIIGDTLMQSASTTFKVSDDAVTERSNLGFSKKQSIWSNDEEK